jgi:hypothetical protein
LQQDVARLQDRVEQLLRARYDVLPTQPTATVYAPHVHERLVELLRAARKP